MPKPVKQDFGVAVGHVVVVGVAIKKQVGRLRDEHAAVAERHSRSQIEPAEKGLGPIHHAVAVGVLENGDDVVAAGTFGRRFGARGRTSCGDTRRLRRA